MSEPIHDPSSGLERPLPPRRALRPPRGYVVGVAAGAVALFSLSLVRTADLDLSDFTGAGEAEAAEAADVPAAEPVARLSASGAEDAAAEAEATEPEVQTAALAVEAAPAPRPAEPTPEPRATTPEPPAPARETPEPRTPRETPFPPPVRVDPEPIRIPEPQGLGEVIPDAVG